MIEALIILGVVVGVFFLFVASLGVLRLEDFFHRIHPPTKTFTLGLFFLLVAVGMAIPSVVVWTKGLLALVFIAVTAPVSAHLLCRAAYHAGVRTATEPDPDEYAPVAEPLRRRHPDHGDQADLDEVVQE